MIIMIWMQLHRWGPLLYFPTVTETRSRWKRPPRSGRSQTPPWTTILGSLALLVGFHFWGVVVGPDQLEIISCCCACIFWRIIMTIGLGWSVSGEVGTYGYGLRCSGGGGGSGVVSGVGIGSPPSTFVCAVACGWRCVVASMGWDMPPM